MKLSGRAKAGIAATAFIVVVGTLVLRVLSSRTNENALQSSLSVMTAADRDRVQRLMKLETAGMTQNEANGIVYYHSSERTGEGNRIYLLWSMAGTNSKTYSIIRSALSKEQLGAAKAVGIAVFVELGFYSFRSKYEIMLSRVFRDEGLGILRGACYRWDGKAGSWAYAADLPNHVVTDLLTPDQKRAILDGTYNVVCATEPVEVK